MPPVSEEEEQENGGKETGPVTHPTPQNRGITSIPSIPSLADQDSSHDELSKSDGLKLRLELNLDVEIELKARLKGEVVLALLA